MRTIKETLKFEVGRAKKTAKDKSQTMRVREYAKLVEKRGTEALAMLAKGATERAAYLHFIGHRK